MQFGIQQKIYVTESEEEAVKMAEHGLWNMRVSLSLRLGREQVERGRVTDVPIENEPSIEELVDRHFLFGTPDTVSEKLMRLEDKLRLDHLNCDFWLGDMPQDKVLRSMELFARYVMPKFQDAHKSGNPYPCRVMAWTRSRKDGRRDGVTGGRCASRGGGLKRLVQEIGRRAKEKALPKQGT